MVPALSFRPAKALGWITALLLAVTLSCGCASQTGGSWTSWVASVIHPTEPSSLTVAELAHQTPERAQQWRDVQPEVRTAPPATQAPTRAVEQQQPKSKPTPPEAAPQPMVTSTMNAATRQEAEAAINAVNSRLARASSADPKGKDGEQINLIRKLRDRAQQALNEQDYLTAQSLAQKASVLAAQLPGSSGQQPPPSR